MADRRFLRPSLSRWISLATAFVVALAVTGCVIETDGGGHGGAHHHHWHGWHEWR